MDKPNRLGRKKHRRKINLGLCLILFLGVVGCGYTENGSSLANSVTPLLIGPTPTLPLDPEIMRKLGPPPYPPHEATVYAQEVDRAHREAILLLTPRPTNTSGPPPVYPSATPQLGLIDGPCSSGISSSPSALSCWEGFVNNTLYRVAAGMRAEERDPVRGQGSVWILRPNSYEHAGDTPLYDTPQKVGDIRIVAVNGTRFTITPAHAESPQVTLIFDMMTHQWLDANGIPWPTATTLATEVP